jgi:hypothetical protein
MVTLVQVGMRQLEGASIGSPHPHAGEGGGGVGGNLLLNRFPKHGPDAVPRVLARPPAACSPPHPCPLPRWGEGSRNASHPYDLLRNMRTISLQPLTQTV